MNWRQHLFEKGASYRVLLNCDVKLGIAYHFHCGEIIIFNQDYYSHYDSLSAYSFQAQDGERFWTLHDSEPKTKCQAYFQKLVEAQSPNSINNL